MRRNVSEPVVTAGSISSRIASHAARAPHQVAIADERGRLTFVELDARSNQLARQLQRARVEPDQCVGLFLDRSADFVVAALAVLKSGAAYLPLDANTPADRAAVMLADAEAPLVLTHRAKTRDWPQGRWRVIEIDRLEPESEDRLDFEPSLESLAYVVYTSGSTGKPKGVEITHANLNNLVDWHQQEFHVTSADRASQVAGLGFDATAWEVWPHLTAGASVHLADELTRRSPQALRDWLIAQRITISFVPTILAEQLIHADWPAATALRTMLTGADVLHRRPIAGLPFELVNNYGPSECTVVATSGTIGADAEIDGPPSIGRPITGATALILDENLSLVTRGEAGELCLAGALVGRGYRNHPELTASRFVTYSPAFGSPLRIYRTGDRVRQLPSGELAFLGRLDEQLKIRGYRIEPGEIVAWLERYPGVEASAVVARDGDAGPMLVAYIVAAREAKLTANDLREFLAARLPDYMIPGQFVKIAELPITANGKLDKSALPAPSTETLLAGRDAIPADAAPGDGASDDGVQTKLSALIANLLGQPSIQPDDNFFLVGGHSMLAAQLVARVHDLFGVKLSLRQLFNAPTVAALANEVSTLLEKRAHA